MEQNAQNGPFYPSSLNPHHALAFTSSQDPAAFLPSGYPSPGYAPPSAPSAANQGFYMMESGQGLDYGKSHEEREASNVATMAAGDSTTKTNTDNHLLQAFDSVNKRLSQLENIVQGLERSIEGLKRAGKEQQTESHDKLSSLELLVKEVLTGVQNLNESQALAGAVSQIRNLRVADEKVSGVEEAAPKASTERWQHPTESHACLESSAISESSTPHVPAAPPAPQSQNYAPAAPPPPQLQNYAASHNGFSLPPSMSESGKPVILHPYLPSGPPPTLAPSSGQLVPPHHGVQVPLFPYAPHAVLPPLSTPSSQGLSNPSADATQYGPMHMHTQYTEPHRPPSHSYSETPQYYGAAPQEGLHSSLPFGGSGNPVYEQPAYMQSWHRSSSPASVYERPASAGYSHYRTAQPVPSSTSAGGGSHARLSKVQPALPASNGMPGGSSAATSRHQISELTETVVGMGVPREKVRAVVQGLTDSGQPVDMNTVLDKLMLRGESSHAQSSGWYNRG